MGLKRVVDINNRSSDDDLRDNLQRVCSCVESLSADGAAVRFLSCVYSLEDLQHV